MFIERLPTVTLRVIAVLSAAAGALVCVFGLPPIGAEIATTHPEHAFWQYPVTVGLYAAAGCFFYALYHFWRVLDGVDRGDGLSGRHLRRIRFGSLGLAALYFAIVIPLLCAAVAAETEDSNPGIVLIAAFVGTFPIAAAAIAAILERFAADLARRIAFTSVKRPE